VLGNLLLELPHSSHPLSNSNSMQQQSAHKSFEYRMPMHPTDAAILAAAQRRPRRPPPSLLFRILPPASPSRPQHPLPVQFHRVPQLPERHDVLLAPDFDAHFSDEQCGCRLTDHAPPLSSPLNLEGAAFALLSTSMREIVQQLADRLNQLAAAQSAANEAAQARHAAVEERADSFAAALSVARDEVALLRWQAEQQQEEQQDAIYKLQLELFELRTGRGSAGPQRPLPPPALSRRLAVGS
jgi:hypothetical protein